jgi:hypothetical protein
VESQGYFLDTSVDPTDARKGASVDPTDARETASGRISRTAAAESPEHLGGTDPGHRLNTGTEVARPSEGAEAPPEKIPHARGQRPAVPGYVDRGPD